MPPTPGTPVELFAWLDEQIALQEQGLAPYDRDAPVTSWSRRKACSPWAHSPGATSSIPCTPPRCLASAFDEAEDLEGSNYSDSPSSLPKTPLLSLRSSTPPPASTLPATCLVARSPAKASRTREATLRAPFWVRALQTRPARPRATLRRLVAACKGCFRAPSEVPTD